MTLCAQKTPKYSYFLIREGIYVKVIGNIRVFNKQRSVVAFYIRPIEDFNEVTHHLAECVYAHVSFTKGIPVVSITD